MKLEDRIPKGGFAVCAWNPENPEKSVPVVAQTLTTEQDAIYASEKYAVWYAKLRNAMQPNSMIEYFVVDGNGMRVY